MAIPTKARVSTASAKSPAKVEKAIAPAKLSTITRTTSVSKTGTSTKAGSSAKGAAASAATTPTATGGWLSRLMAPPPPNQAPGAPKPASNRFVFGMMIYILIVYFVQFLLLFLNGRFNLGLTSQTYFTLPILGNVNGLTIISLIIMAVALWALYKLKILPSNQQMAASAAAQRAAREQAKGGTASKSGTITSKNGTAGKNALSAKNGATARTTTTSTKAGAKTTTAGKPSTTTRPLATTAKGTKNATPEPAVTSENDDMYEQFKAHKLAQARKARSKR